MYTLSCGSRWGCHGDPPNRKCVLSELPTLVLPYCVPSTHPTQGGGDGRDYGPGQGDQKWGGERMGTCRPSVALGGRWVCTQSGCCSTPNPSCPPRGQGPQMSKNSPGINRMISPRELRQEDVRVGVEAGGRLGSAEQQDRSHTQCACCGDVVSEGPAHPGMKDRMVFSSPTHSSDM